MRSLRGRLYHRPDATAVFRTRGLVTAKPTAFGRVTERASSDPACFSPTCEGFGRLSGDRGQAGNSSSTEKPMPRTVSEPGPLRLHAPNGGNPTHTAPSGGHPNTTASGRG